MTRADRLAGVVATSWGCTWSIDSQAVVSLPAAAAVHCFMDFGKIADFHKTLDHSREVALVDAGIFGNLGLGPARQPQVKLVSAPNRGRSTSRPREAPRRHRPGERVEGLDQDARRQTRPRACRSPRRRGGHVLGLHLVDR